MRKFIFLLFFINSLHAHDIHYDQVLLKHWKVNHEKNDIVGSFYLYRDGQVFLENEKQQIIQIPFANLSNEDKAFVNNKMAQIETLNRKIQFRNQPNASSNYSVLYFLLISSLIVGLGWFGFRNIEKSKVKFIMPIFLVGIGSLFLAGTDPAVVNAAFSAFATNVKTSWDSDYFYVESKGIPTTHNMMVGISNHGWQQQVPIPQCYTGSNHWSIPLNPTMATTPVPADGTHFLRGAIAIAVNGIPIFNVHTNTGVDSYIDGQLDSFGGHCGRADDYHYHIAPLHLYNYTSSTLPIAYALDGYAIFGAKEPDGTAMQTLDANHGHSFKGTYHYHGTTSAPYMIGNMVGKVTEDATLQIIPQASASPVRTENWTPLSGALITSCTPNSAKNGYNLSYSLNGTAGYATNFSWSGTTYTFNYVTPSGTTTKSYNGFAQCTTPSNPSSQIQSNASLEPTISIYPNPAKDYIAISLLQPTMNRDIKSMSIFTLQGKKVFESNHFEAYISTKNLSKGIYIVKIQTENSAYSKKIQIED